MNPTNAKCDVLLVSEKPTSLPKDANTFESNDVVQSTTPVSPKKGLKTIAVAITILNNLLDNTFLIDFIGAMVPGSVTDGLRNRAAIDYLISLYVTPASAIGSKDISGMPAFAGPASFHDMAKVIIQHGTFANTSSTLADWLDLVRAIIAYFSDRRVDAKWVGMEVFLDLLYSTHAARLGIINMPLCVRQSSEGARVFDALWTFVDHLFAKIESDTSVSAAILFIMNKAPVVSVPLANNSSVPQSDCPTKEVVDTPTQKPATITPAKPENLPTGVAEKPSDNSWSSVAIKSASKKRQSPVSRSLTTHTVEFTNFTGSADSSKMKILGDLVLISSDQAKDGQYIRDAVQYVAQVTEYNMIMVLLFRMNNETYIGLLRLRPMIKNSVCKDFHYKNLRFRIPYALDSHGKGGSTILKNIIRGTNNLTNLQHDIAGAIHRLNSDADEFAGYVGFFYTGFNCASNVLEDMTKILSKAQSISAQTPIATQVEQFTSYCMGVFDHRCTTAGGTKWVACVAITASCWNTVDHDTTMDGLIDCLADDLNCSIQFVFN